MPHDGGIVSAMGAWTVMMVSMMLPSLSPTLWRYHRALDTMGASRAGHQALLFTIAYVGVWATAATVVFGLAAALGAEMQRHAVARLAPLATSALVIASGAMQLTRWKAHHLVHCRADPAGGGDARGGARNMMSACHEGLRHGVHCTASCAGYTATLIAVGAMDPRVMLAMTAAITAERVLPAGTRIARSMGVIGLVAGGIMLEHAVLVGAVVIR